MNYIAHLHIAKLTHTSYAGNLLGDFPWQPDPKQRALWQGWRLHQAIDTFVDAHPQSQRFKTLPRTGRRRFAGIVQDILMDYWLVRLWSQFDQQPFDHFAHQVVQQLSRDKPLCPERLQGMIGSLEQNNWLADLGTDWGVNERYVRFKDVGR
ncbi:Acyl carrier protein phosphodiesterase [Marinomonas aquimarina]|uniref:Acyl carrier protein phosphodiesterase n=1 Tax=Marinomonas aquimarina TaxID=295068 RepID=A0A1A8TE78_9GAMM|nr:ACP phosphodiesterase [Marinomonas aquimarina]SBS30367.1 Acyl carrier protein phosphodiesterase [Marinomonas aquimarina]